MIYVTAMFTSRSEYDNMCRMFLITVQSRKNKSVTLSKSAAASYIKAFII